MVEVGLFDGSFQNGNSATYSGDNAGLSPKNIRYVRNEALPITFYTDMWIEHVVYAPDNIMKVAFLLEAPSISDQHYRQAIALHDKFDYILSHRIDLFTTNKWLFYPFGGSRIRPEDWGIFDKTKSVSLFVSEKRAATGHRFRAEIQSKAQEYGIDVYGRGSNPVESKVVGLRDYHYSIVVENMRCNVWFTEKIIDCISQGTVPIYWGTENIGDFFDTSGIIQFETMDELAHILDDISVDDYYSRILAIKNNFVEAQKYVCAEDWIFENRPEIFS